jgi:hypothetical protein
MEIWVNTLQKSISKAFKARRSLSGYSKMLISSWTDIALGHWISWDTAQERWPNLLKRGGKE